MTATEAAARSIETTGPRPLIMVVDDEEDIRDEIKDYLEPNGFEVVGAGNTVQASRLLSERPFDLLILDYWLGDTSGMDMLREIRRASTLPCIMLTGNREHVDRIVALEIGADDYLLKPVDLRELLARIRTVLRRTAKGGALAATEGQGRLSVARPTTSWALDRAKRRIVASDGRAIRLTTAEYELMASFCDRPNDIQSREDLFRTVLGRNWTPLDRSLDNLVVKLRRKLEEEGISRDAIKSIRSVGYIFTGFDG